MVSMSDDVIQKDISEAVGLSGLSDDEKVVFLANIGDVVLDASFLRLVADLSEDQQEALQQFLETEPTPENLMKHLLEHHQQFETILEEEIAAFKEEALTVVGAVPDDE